MQRNLQFTLVAASLALVVIGALFVHVLRFEYVPVFGSDGGFQHLTFRIDKLTGDRCFIALTEQGRNAGQTVLLSKECQ